MIKRFLMFRGSPDYQRAPDSLEGPDSQRAPDEQRALDAQRTPDIHRAPDSWEGPNIQKDHWWWLWLSLGPLIVTGSWFSGGPDCQTGPNCPDVLFGRFPYRFRDFCEGFGCFRRSFGSSGPSAHGGPKTPRGARTPSAPPPLATSLAVIVD